MRRTNMDEAASSRLNADILIPVSLLIISWFYSLTPAHAGENRGRMTADEMMPVTNQMLVVFDIETTGFSSRNDRMLEIAAVKFRGKTVVETMCELIDPNTRIPTVATSIHGITDAQVKGKKRADKVLFAFTEFIGGCVLLAHNASFDVRFVKAEAERHSVKMNGNRVIDTMRLARKWFPDAKSYSLKKLSTDLGIPTSGHHRALADAHMTRELFLRGLDTMRPGATIHDLEKLDGRTRALP